MSYPTQPGQPTWPAQPGQNPWPAQSGQPGWPAQPAPPAAPGQAWPAPGQAWPAHQGQAPYPSQQPAPAPWSAPPAPGQWPAQQAPAPAPGQPWQSDAHLPGGYVCRFCGCTPAADVTFRGHRGMIILMSFLHMKGPFCRDCGLATFRRMTANTLLVGWWGWASVFITPITVLINLVRRGKVANLAAPQRVPGIVPQIPAPLNPGKPVLARPQALAGIGAVVVILVALIGLALHQNSLEQVGGCTNNTDFVSCDSPHDGKIIDIVEKDSQCPPSTDAALLANGRVYCLVDD